MKQQTIIIIGATSGIGKTLFEKYAPDGTILARGLAGENIEQQLKKIFND